jgi:hypothetical protein
MDAENKPLTDGKEHAPFRLWKTTPGETVSQFSDFRFLTSGPDLSSSVFLTAAWWSNHLLHRAQIPEAIDIENKTLKNLRAPSKHSLETEN